MTFWPFLLQHFKVTSIKLDYLDLYSAPEGSRMTHPHISPSLLEILCLKGVDYAKFPFK